MANNGGYDYCEQIGPQVDGETLLEYLSRRYRHSTVEQWAARIESGQVLVDLRATSPGTILRRGQSLVWRRPPWNEPEAPETLEILFEDEDILAVAKPAGLPTLPGAGFLRGTLLHRVKTHAADAVPLHRLGRWTSGVVVLARSPLAREEMARQFAARAIKKRYRALVQGDPGWSELTIEVPIGRVPHPLLGSVHAASPEGRAASTHVVILERRTAAALCDVHITTGRPHQIRIHLSSAGHPLIGDPLYHSGGLPLPGSQALPGDPGYHLHAAEMSFLHPRSGRTITIACEPPALLRPSADDHLRR